MTKTLSGCRFESSCNTWTSDIAPILSKEFLGIQATTECRFTLKCICDMMRTHSQMHHTNKYSKHSSIIQLNSWVLIDDLSGCGFQSSCSHLHFKYCTCSEQGVPWHSGNIWNFKTFCNFACSRSLKNALSILNQGI